MYVTPVNGPESHGDNDEKIAHINENQMAPILCRLLARAVLIIL